MLSQTDTSSNNRTVMDEIMTFESDFSDENLGSPPVFNKLPF
jgi:hypothetical protein